MNIHINALFIPILLPLVFGLLLLVWPKALKAALGWAAVFGAALNMALAVLFFGKQSVVTIPWAGFGMDFSMRLYGFSSFILLAAAFFTLAVVFYCVSFLKDKDFAGKFYFYLFLTTAMVNGAVLANNLILMLFFWEGLMVPLYGMISIGKPDAYKTAVKAFIIVGISDLCLMLGIGLTGHLAGTLTMTDIHLPLSRYANAAFILLMIGAISKAGSMPFHSWIPDAANDAPLPFMAFLPAALEKLLGIYFLSRISLDLFIMNPDSKLSYIMMTVGVITILFAVMMALIQKDYKRLLSYHAISQVGYMVLGIGTAVPVGIVGGIFHMINHAMYKSGLFLTGGSVEKQAGTTDLKKLGGLGLKMPITFACFIITAAAISGVPPLNGFFSKELVYDGALERHWIFYAGALLGSFLTAASFLKLGHSAFMGKLSDENKNVKEAPVVMLIPMITIALVCVFFGLFNGIPLSKFIVPVLGERGLGHVFSGFPANMMLVLATCVVLIAAFLNHIFGVKKSGSGLGAADHIHHAPVLSTVYGQAEKNGDPYDIGYGLANIISRFLYNVDKAFDWCYNGFSVKISYFASNVLCAIHDGNYSSYLLWSVVGAGAVLFMLFR
jgi:formate hydrogenlyase subunit 3/multisubunit Na+/H+ antiporter MnhD subunit